jgi:hypothetical protein
MADGTAMLFLDDPSATRLDTRRLEDEISSLKRELADARKDNANKVR